MLTIIYSCRLKSNNALRANLDATPKKAYYLNLRVWQWAARPPWNTTLRFIRIIVIGRSFSPYAADLRMQWLSHQVELTFFKEYSFRVVDYILGHPIRGAIYNPQEDSKNDYGSAVEVRAVTESGKLGETISQLVNSLRPRRPMRPAA